MPGCDVVIAGAGPTGLTLACALLAGGARVRVVDQAAAPAQTSRALGLQPRGIEVLDRIGALGDLETRANPIGAVVVDLGGRRAARLQLGRRTTLVTRPGLLVSQAVIEEGLRRRLAELGGTLEWGHGVLDATDDGDAVTVDLTDGTTIRCAWLVGCDGAHSRVRTVAGIGFPGVQVVERFLLADVHADLPIPRDTASVWLRGDDMIAAFPLPGADLWRLMAPAAGDGGEEPRTPEVLALLTRLLHEHTGIPASAVRGAEWTSVFRIHRRLADHYRSGRLLVAGDAAHIHSPLGGQGLNTGIGDAENLAWKLALVIDGRADPVLLDSYQDERRPIASKVLASTSSMTRMVVGQTRLARALRDHVFVPSLNRAWVQQLIWERASQLKISYRRGPLGPRGPIGARPGPGDRIPDLACLRGDGRPTRLHAELGPSWALVIPAGASESARDLTRGCTDVARARLGAVTELTAAAGASRHAILVRPDAHVGWRGAPYPAALDAWLTGLLREGRAPGHARRTPSADGLAPRRVRRPGPPP